MGTRLSASFSVEASMVLTVVILSLCTLIHHAYRLHDTVTGSMILEEVLVRARSGMHYDETKLPEEYEMYGKELGNPRLTLGTYKIEVESGTEDVSGIASAGDWEQEISIPYFLPGQFLRQTDALLEIGKEMTGDGSRIQAGNEPELYGDPAAGNME